MNEAANDSARVSGQDRKKPSALGTNQIAGFGGFHPLASLEKKINKRKKKKKKTRELQARFRPEVALWKGIRIPGSRKLLLVESESLASEYWIQLASQQALIGTW